MTTGFRIKHSKDNAANYAISTNMTTKIDSLYVAENNASTGLDLVNTASDSLSLMQDRVQRLRDLQEQANNGTYGSESLNAINAECNALVDEINRLYLKSEYNGINLFLQTTTDTGGKEQIFQEVLADSTTKFSDLGITSGSFSVLDSTGNIEESYDIEENDTIGDLLSTIRSHGLNASIERGKITISSIDGKYVNGDLMTALGINTQSSSFVESTAQTTTLQVTYTETTTIPGYTYTSGIAQTSEVLDYTTTTTTTITETYTSGIAQTSEVLDYTVTTTTTSTETSSFINDITRRDTRYMTSLSSVDPTSDLADGTYKISTPDELAQLATMTNAGLISSGDEFVLASNIDLSGYSNRTPIGTDDNRFTGQFDGNGYVISNLNVDGILSSNVGLFGFVDGGSIYNLGLENAKARSNNNFVGSLIGKLQNGTVSNCYANGGEVYAGQYAGGLIGYACNCEIRDCWANINSASTDFVGGFVGTAQGYNLYIENCFSLGSVQGGSSVGGVVGCSYHGLFKNCYSTGTVSGHFNYVGNFIGDCRSSCTFTNCYATVNPTLNFSGYDSTLVNSPVFTISNTATVTNEMKDKISVTATESTALSFLGLAQDGTIEVVSKPTTTAVSSSTSTIAVSSSTTLGELITALQDMGITASLSAGQLSIDASDLIYIDSISSALGSVIGIGSGAGKSFNTTTVTNEKEDTSSVTATESTALSFLGLAQDGAIEVVSKATTTAVSGSTSTIAVSNSTTLGELVTALQGMGLTASLSAGRLSIDASDLIYIDSISSPLSSVIGIGSGAGTSFNTTTIAPVVNTETYTLSNSTTMGKLGLNTSKNVTVISNGTSSSFIIDPNTTFAQLQQSLQSKGFTVGLNDGIVTLNADSDIYLNSVDLSALLNLGAVNKTESLTQKNLPSSVIKYVIDLIDQVGNVYAPGEVVLQVGIDADINSRLSVQLSFSIGSYQNFRKIGLDNNDYLTEIDDMLAILNERQVEFGAVQNRLMSVLDEIAIKRDNLISSRSTLRDADIAELSSTYIQQQILQQASATLLATANQSPSIALQLI